MSYSVSKSELYHYGVKGMRWGIRRSKEVLKAQQKAQNEMLDALSSGKVSTKIKVASQMRHLKAAPNYDGHRSYLATNNLKEVQKLINELSGSGSACGTKSGEWVRKERVTSNRVIGVYVDENGIGHKTRKAMIAYSKNGAHIYPRR